ncbi:MAG: hypothetical protein P0S94_00330, partial [Simkaniaceae bacterium]|nr:hypothetical protein [Simkaniaceae bacterium]
CRSGRSRVIFAKLRNEKIPEMTLCVEAGIAAFCLRQGLQNPLRAALAVPHGPTLPYAWGTIR